MDGAKHVIKDSARILSYDKDNFPENLEKVRKRQGKLFHRDIRKLFENIMENGTRMWKSTIAES